MVHVIGMVGMVSRTHLHYTRAYLAYVIQIKICAEYRDMLPKPRLVYQEPGLINTAEAWVAYPSILHRS